MVDWGRIEVDQGTHKPAGPGTSSSGRGDLGQVPDIWPAWTEHLRAAPGTTDLLCTHVFY